MPTISEYGCETEGYDPEDQLYMMEVIIDRVAVKEGAALSGPDPVLPILAKIAFAEFPIMEVERNQLLLTEDIDKPEDNSHGAPSLSVIAGLPEDWTVKLGPGDTVYTVQVPYRCQSGEEQRHPVLVPKAVARSGEGLRYILAALRQQLGNEVCQAVQVHITKELAKAREAGTARAAVTSHQFSAGKSFLFHMSPMELNANIAQHPVKVQIFRNSSEGMGFVHTLIGESKIHLGLSFIKAVLVATTSGALHPTTAHLEDTFPMADTFNRVTGDIRLFIRLSCFGPSLIPNEEDENIKKQQVLKNIMMEEFNSYRKGNVDIKYPWKKNLNAVEERVGPTPWLDFIDEPICGKPPTPSPPFDFGTLLPNVPRCTPSTAPPCYRRAGDPPLPRCQKEMENQLRREDLSKYAQTEAANNRNESNLREIKNYDFENYTTNQALSVPPVPATEPHDNKLENKLGTCTCPSIPPELQNTGQQNDCNLQCTCASIINSISSPQEKTLENQLKSKAKPTKSNVLGGSDYEIELTKAECSLEQKTEAQEKSPETKSNLKMKTVKSEAAIKPSEPAQQAQKIPIEETKKHKEVQNKLQTVEKEKPEDVVQSPTEVHNDWEKESDVEEEESAETKAALKKKRDNVYQETPGLYPVHNYGHRRCVINRKLVPKNMGWLWTNIDFGQLLKKTVWPPGTIRNDVSSMLGKVKDNDDKGDVPALSFGTGTALRHPRTRQATRPQSKGKDNKYNPNLHIHKKEGYYYVTMIPVKTDSQEEVGGEPNPIEYKIDPKHPDGLETGESCDVGSSSSSDVKSYEMNFIVPLAMQKRKKKVEKIVKDTQYNEQDFTKKILKKDIPEEAPKQKKEKKCKKEQKDKKKGKKK